MAAVDYEVCRWEILAAAHHIVGVEKVDVEDESAVVVSALIACYPGNFPLSAEFEGGYSDLGDGAFEVF